ncbi:D-glycero-beta-D-manno-heptose 1-phosphate adenylyltransferase [Candidatus Poribacteria bacterium]|nr:D-glycero-beta-D-manno-heptose 1-phosphate adenylyltransferase [Candidatus Poribacteria bacterium]
MTIEIPKIYQLKELTTHLDDIKKQGNVVVTTNGCFDVLHLGHLRYLQAAKKLGDILVVAVNSDESVRQLKGQNRPLVPQDERAEMLAGLECVDYVVIFPELTPIKLLSKLKPNIHVKGGDYKLEQLVERDVVEENGGRVVVGINVPGKSTTNLIEVICKQYNSS